MRERVRLVFFSRGERVADEIVILTLLMRRHYSNEMEAMKVKRRKEEEESVNVDIMTSRKMSGNGELLAKIFI